VGLSGNRQGLVLNWLVFACLAAIGSALGWTVWVSRSALSWVDHTHDVIHQVQQLREVILDAETAQEGFLLTGDENYLAPYQRALPKIAKSLQVLRDSTADNAIQQERLKLIGFAIKLTLDELAAAIRVRRAQGEDAARIIVDTQRDGSPVEQTRLLLSEFQAEEDALLKVRTERRGWELVYITLGTTGGLVLLFVFFLVARNSRAVLLQSETKSRILFESAPFGGLIVDPDNLAILDVNQHLRGQLGYTNEELESLRLDDIVPVPLEQLQRGIVASPNPLTAGRVFQFESIFKTKKHGVRDVLVNAASVRLQGKFLFYLALNDITEKKQLAKAAQENEAQFSTLANAIPQLCWMANAEGWTFWYNERWYQYTGKTPKQMQGWGWESVHDPQILPQVLERWRVSLATGEPFDMVFPLRGADGRFRPFLTRVMPVTDQDGKVVRWFGTNTEISEHCTVAQA
jgi:PAS domain S-box-containing protein